MKRTDVTIEEVEAYIHHKIQECENDIKRLNRPLCHLPEIQKQTLEDVLHAIDKIEFINLNKENV